MHAPPLSPQLYIEITGRAEGAKMAHNVVEVGDEVLRRWLVVVGASERVKSSDHFHWSCQHDRSLRIAL
jgi:hypothetical protein